MIGLKWSLWESLLSSVSTCWVESLQCGVFATNQYTQIVATLISCWSRHPRCSWRWVATVEIKGSPICMWVWLSGLWSSRRTWSEWRVKFFISSGCPRFFTVLLIRSKNVPGQILFSLKFRNTSPQPTLSFQSWPYTNYHQRHQKLRYPNVTSNPCYSICNSTTGGLPDTQYSLLESWKRCYSIKNAKKKMKNIELIIAV